MNIFIVAAWNGHPDFYPKTFEGKYYSVVSVGKSFSQIVVREDSPIKTVSDLAGKTVFVGDAGAASTAANLAILSALKIDCKQIMTDRDEGYNMLKDGRVDAAMQIAASPYATIISTANDTACRIVSYTDAEMAACIAENPYMSKSALPASDYEFLKEDVPTLVMIQNINCAASLDENVVYELTKAICESWSNICAVVPACAKIDPLVNVNDNVVPIAPGAVKYYTEKGVTIKDELKP